MINKIIFTSENGDEQISLNEIKNITPKPKNVEFLAKGICLVELDEEYSNFMKKLQFKKPVFIRHIMPVFSQDFLSPINIIEQIYTIVNNNIGFLDKNLKFSVQSRVVNCEFFIKTFDINKGITEKLIENLYIEDYKNPEQIISVLICSDKIYIGISLKNDNLSSWSGGNIRFEKKEDFISRAEFKLLEAIQTFELKLGKNALDLGAAPGGWTKVLSEYCNSVVAVDPAELDKSLIDNPKIIHEKITAQEFFRKTDAIFDIITNDMKMEVNESLDIMIEAKKFLADDGICIMTLKLSQKKQQKQVYKAIDVINKYFRVLHARKLFHNRCEATVVFCKK